MMKTISRVLITAVAAPTLAFGLPTAALADSFYEANATFAGPHGAGSQSICAAAFDRGHHHGPWIGGGFHGKRGCDRDFHRGPWFD
ncbi:hypothetical protein KIK06_13205 [Nocardiopsis sp. EMB25]|uniref:hypothetical protein n=1 Tax=Nocardiopsis TaxID=2013 RepID=UPI00034DCB06|nr:MULTISPECIES: hypothetical protein [Nocardiopsis]MCY9784848.1 hypothetical protein [Nocardiopsis sp. EMB25]